jgi:DNA-binding HxlR family transcriptional regulator
MPAAAHAMAHLQDLPASMDDQLSTIQSWCRQFSARHRLAFPPELVRERIHGLARAAGPLFQDRAVEICFLLDQCGTLRFNEMRRALGAISTRTLADKLAFLQREGIVLRTLYDETPPRVEYRLTARGRTLADLLVPALVHIARPAAPEAKA